MIAILMTVGILSAEQRKPVLAALRQNIANPLVSGIHVATEAQSPELIAWLPEAAGANADQLHLRYLPTRPTFSEMLSISNELLASGIDTVALMNADISIASEADAARMLKTLAHFDGRNYPIILVLSRRDSVENCHVSDELYDSAYLPNTLSADCWVLQHPFRAHLDRDLFYSPGQMNCDMMLAYDLLSTSHQLFNPCLDIAIVHHEKCKSETYYSEKNTNKEQLRSTVWRHIKLNAIVPWNYFGIPWVHSEWLQQGYAPNAVSTNGRRLILALQTGADHRLGQMFPILDELVASCGFEVQVLFDGNLDDLVRIYVDASTHRPYISFAKPKYGIDATIRALIGGKQSFCDRLAFVSDLSRVDTALLAAADCIVLNIRPDFVVYPPIFGCTLVTSVFRSELFLRGFVNNITNLLGYNSLIEHILLVSMLSDTEIEVLHSLFSQNSNVIILWNRSDPGLYECWNIGIRMSRTDYVSNANVDDLRHPDHIVTLLGHLESHPQMAVAASTLVPFYDYPPDGSIPIANEIWYSDQAGRFEFRNLGLVVGTSALSLSPNNIPHCMPVWRRSLHNQYGWFDERRFGTFADWAYWLKVFEDNRFGWLDPMPLSFYYVNPHSHNRRGTNLLEFHKAVENEFLLHFVNRAAGKLRQPHGLPCNTARKLHLRGLEHSYGEHRTSFNAMIAALEPLNRGEGGVRLIPFLERQFVWGDSASDGEAASSDARPITEQWIGILHVPFDTPDWFEHTVNPKHFFATPLFRSSLPYCRGIITLSADLELELKAFLPDIPTLSVKFPTTLDARMWEPAAYTFNPCVVQVGDWLRKLQSIHRLKIRNHRRVMLLKAHTAEFLKREIKVFGDIIDPSVEMLKLVPNEEYDELLAQSVVICLMYGTAANNVVIECIARATPILINPLPGVVEYLGENYPLYVADEAHADIILGSQEKIMEAHHYLLKRRCELDLSYEGFCNRVADSLLYERLS